jgi:cytochrome c oxidase assembly protein subunit 15
MTNQLKPVQIWIYTGCAMIFAMVLIGGITRLTDSGLSIVEWKPIMGAIPPLNDAQWHEAFEKYKLIPQYTLMNKGMSMTEFKNIFFWEYLHRLWGRLIGVVFIIPFVFFLIKGMLPKPLLLKLLVVFFLGGLQGFVGWFMVQSGLSENVSVSHFRLALHLMMAILLYSYLLYIGFFLSNKPSFALPAAKKQVLNLSYSLVALLVLQLFYGALMAGLKAGLFYPTYPLMNNQIIPDGFTTMDTWCQNLFSNITSVQFIHRNIPILIGIVLLLIWRKTRQLQDKTLSTSIFLIIGTYILQFVLGVVTVLNCVGHIPLLWGVLHQMGAMVLFTVALLYHFRLKSVCV